MSSVVLQVRYNKNYNFLIDQTFHLVLEHLRGLYNYAGSIHCWQVVRYCSSLLGHTVDSISPFITAVLVHGKQVRKFFKTN